MNKLESAIMRGVMPLNNDLKALINLMLDYNLTWGAVYNIVREAIEELGE